MQICIATTGRIRRFEPQRNGFFCQRPGCEASNVFASAHSGVNWILNVTVIDKMDHVISYGAATRDYVQSKQPKLTM